MSDAGVQVEIRAVKGFVPLNLRELAAYRDLLFFFLWRDLRGRYRQMLLGPLWIILGPLINMLLFTLLFGRLAGLGPAGIPYPIYNYSALLLWGLFAGSVNAASSSLLDARYLISKVYFPRLIMPLVGGLSAFVNFVASFVVLLVMMAWYGVMPGWSVLFLPLFLLLAMITGLGVGLWWATWVVHFRDLQTVLDYLLKGWMYACPIVYAIELVPESWRWLYRLNPMTSAVEGLRWSLLGYGRPVWSAVAFGFAVMIPVAIAGAYYFRKTERRIVDIA